MHEAVERVINIVEKSCGWDKFNEMCLDAPDISSRQKQEVFMREQVGAELFEASKQYNNFNNLLAEFVVVQVKAWIGTLFVRLLETNTVVNLNDLETFIFEMFFKRSK